MEAAACGAMTGVHAARAMLGLPPVDFPRESAFGAVVAHLQNQETHDFQPSNVTWGHFPTVEGVGKKQRRLLLAERALAAIESMVG